MCPLSLISDPPVCIRSRFRPSMEPTRFISFSLYFSMSTSYKIKQILRLRSLSYKDLSAVAVGVVVADLAGFEPPSEHAKRGFHNDTGL
jgi:hypothetical protein